MYLILIAYLGDKAPTVALMLAIALCVTMSLPSREQFFVDALQPDTDLCDGKTKVECNEAPCSWDSARDECSAVQSENDDHMAQSDSGAIATDDGANATGDDTFTASNDVENFAPF